MLHYYALSHCVDAERRCPSLPTLFSRGIVAHSVEKVTEERDIKDVEEGIGKKRGIVQPPSVQGVHALHGTRLPRFTSPRAQKSSAVFTIGRRVIQPPGSQAQADASLSPRRAAKHTGPVLLCRLHTLRRAEMARTTMPATFSNPFQPAST